MKKLFALMFIAFFALTQMAAQDPIFVKGDKVLNLGIGLGTTLYTGSYYHMTVPPISASLELGILESALMLDSLPTNGNIQVGVINTQILFSEPEVTFIILS